MFAPHYYDPGIFLNRWNKSRLQGAIGRWKKVQQQWDAPVFLGEFGASPGKMQGYLDEIYNQLNKNLISGAQWNYTPNWSKESKDGWNNEDFSIVDDKGNLRNNFQKRPYPQAIAGKVLSLNTEKGFELRWQQDGRAQEPTIIYFPGIKGKKMNLLGTSEKASCTAVGEDHVHCRGSEGEILTLTIF